MLGGSTFRIKCGDDGFHQDTLNFPHQPSTGDIHCARSKVPQAAYRSDSFQSMTSVVNKWFSRQAPNSRSCDEFSVDELLQRLQSVLFTLRDPKLNAVHNGTAHERHFPREMEVVAREWESLNAEAVCASRSGSHAPRRTLPCGCHVVRSAFPGVDEEISSG